MRRPTAVTNSLDSVARYSYCSCGALDFVTNAYGTSIEQDTAFTRDGQGHLLIASYADGYDATNWYDVLGRRATAVASGLLLVVRAFGGLALLYSCR